MANTADQNTDSLITGAFGPQSVSTEAGRVQSQSITDQIEAIKFSAGQAAGKKKRLGIRTRKFIPPGMVPGTVIATSDTGDGAGF